MRPQSRAVVGRLAEFEEVARLIAQARRKVWSGVARVLAPQGEVVLGWALVSVLQRLGPRSQRDLADIIGQHPAGISRQLAELDRAGLTTRTEDASDRRCRLVALTPEGRRWHRRWRPHVLRAVGEILGVLDEAEREGLRTSLLKVLDPPAAAAGATPHGSRPKRVPPATEGRGGRGRPATRGAR